MNTQERKEGRKEKKDREKEREREGVIRYSK